MVDYDDDHLVDRVLTPDEICDELNKDFDTLEITEDETEILMQEALALNKRLKVELKRQSGGGGGRIASSLDSSPLAAKPPRHGGKGSRTLLPPIRSDKHGATSSSKRSPGQKGKKGASNRASLSAGSTSSSRNPSTSKSRPRGSKSADNKPGWNDRFSYSD